MTYIKNNVPQFRHAASDGNTRPADGFDRQSMALHARRFRRDITTCLILPILLSPGIAGQPARASEGLIGAGYGISHADRAAWQASIGFNKYFEAHVSAWNGPNRNRALTGGYRLPVTPYVSVMLGVAYLERDTPNIHQGLNGASELRVNLGRRWACQLTHYSGDGSDISDNLLLCGYLWQRR